MTRDNKRQAWQRRKGGVDGGAWTRVVSIPGELFNGVFFGRVVMVGATEKREGERRTVQACGAGSARRKRSCNSSESAGISIAA